MANSTLTRCTAAAGLAAVLTLAAITTGAAEPRWGEAAAVGAGVGLAVAAAATAVASPNYNGYGAGYYDYDPDAVAVTPASGYYDSAAPYAFPRPGVCHFSIRGC